MQYRGPYQFLGSIVVSIPACHAGDRGSVPRRGGFFFFNFVFILIFLFNVVLRSNLFSSFVSFTSIF